VLTLAAGGTLAVALGVLSAAAAPEREPAAAGPVAATTEAGEPTETAEPVEGSEPTESTEPVETARPAPARADYAGRVKNDGGLIAISVRNGKVVAYYCDGKIETWFQGKAEQEEVTLDGVGAAAGKATVTAVLAAGKATGEIDLGKRRLEFSASTAKKPSGLYRASAIIRGARLKSGWIVLADGTQTGFTSLGDKQVPTPTLTPGTDPTIDGTRVDAKDADEFIEEMS
jgi:hypothetical protein